MIFASWHAHFWRYDDTLDVFSEGLTCLWTQEFFQMKLCATCSIASVFSLIPIQAWLKQIHFFFLYRNKFHKILNHLDNVPQSLDSKTIKCSFGFSLGFLLRLLPFSHLAEITQLNIFFLCFWFCAFSFDDYHPPLISCPWCSRSWMSIKSFLGQSKAPVTSGAIVTRRTEFLFLKQPVRRF